MFAECNDIDTAATHLDKLNDTAAEKHHRVVQHLFEKFGTHLRQIANGDLSCLGDRAFSQEMDVWKDMPWVSDVADGYHRSTKLTETRAPGALKPFVLARDRLTQNLNELEGLCETYHGVAMFNRAYVNFSSVVRKEPSARCGQRKRKAADVYAEVYRLGRYSRFDWPLLSADGACAAFSMNISVQLSR